MNFVPTWQQAQALSIVQYECHAPFANRKKRLAVKSGKGPGKTTVMVIIAIFRLLQAPGSLAIMTAPTMRQCKDVFLAEFRRLLEKAKALLRAMIKVTTTRVEICGQRDWGVWLATSSNPVNMQGYHQKNLTFLGDEASGIDRRSIQAIKDTLTNSNSLLCLIGNPNSDDCSFYDCFARERAQWHTLTWNAEEVPPTHPDYEGIMTRNRLCALEYGKDSDIYRIAVLGEFPHSNPQAIMTLADVEACTQTRMLDCARNVTELSNNKVLAYDFARFGGDENVVYRRSGLAIVEHEEFAHIEPGDLVLHGFRLQHQASWKNSECWHVADASGMGQGVLGDFYNAKKQVFEFHNGGSSTDKQFHNRITEAWFNLARLARAHSIHIPEDNRLLQQLTTRRYFLVKKTGKLIVEPKDDYMDRGHDSPDRADACVMAFYDQLRADAQAGGSAEPQHRVGIRKS